MRVEGVELTEVAESVGTPFYCYSAASVSAAYGRQLAGGRLVDGVREGAWEADRTIELKVICDADVADRIGDAVLAAYGKHYGMSIFFSDVAVLRADKY